MKFTAGAMVGNLSGSIGSTTASRNKFGSYFRSRVVPVNPNTVRQQDVRAIFATLVNAWTNTLTPSQRTNWTNWADNTTIKGKDGTPINITGQNAYVRFNTVRLQIGGVRVDAAPTDFNNGSPPTGFRSSTDLITGEIGNVGGNFSTDILVGGGAAFEADVVVWLGAPINESRVFFKGPYQLSASEAIAQGITFIPFATTALLQEQAIDLLTGQFRSLKARVCYDDGRLSESFEALADVVTDTV